MDRKLKNTIILLVALVILTAIGSFLKFFYFKNKIEQKEKEINELKINEYNTEELLAQLDTLKIKAAKLDSILANRKYNIPVDLKQSKFYDFVSNVTQDNSEHSYTSIEFLEQKQEIHYSYYLYKLSGVATYNDFYKLIFSIEESKELKKIVKSQLTNNVKVDEDGIPFFLVNYEVETRVYFADNDRFVSTNFKENLLNTSSIYDIFYPLIRKEIPPNVDNLIDVQNASVLAITSDGAYVSDANGNSNMLWEGDPVYLGHLTKIDFEKNKVSFILNKGGIIERVELTLDKNQETKEKKKIRKK